MPNLHIVDMREWFCVVLDLTGFLYHIGFPVACFFWPVAIVFLLFYFFPFFNNQNQKRKNGREMVNSFGVRLHVLFICVG